VGFGQDLPIRHHMGKSEMSIEWGCLDIRSGCGALGSQRPWYLGAKQAKLRRASLVPMMKTADLGYRDHVSLLWRLDSAGNGRVLSQCQMCPGSMIVGQEASDSASEMSFAEDDDVVKHPRRRVPITLSR